VIQQVGRLAVEMGLVSTFGWTPLRGYRIDPICERIRGLEGAASSVATRYVAFRTTETEFARLLDRGVRSGMYDSTDHEGGWGDE
jgi:hypothetical protein